MANVQQQRQQQLSTNPKSDNNDNDDMALSSSSSSLVQGDVLIKVFSCLAWQEVLVCRVVCRSWKEAVAATPVRVCLETATTATTTTAAAADDAATITTTITRRSEALARCFPHLQSLRIPHGGAVTDGQMAATLGQFQYLQDFCCREATQIRYSMTHILQLSHLTSLNLHNNTQLEYQLADLTALPHLQDLRIINNKGVTGCLLDLQPLSQYMQVLDVSGCTRVTGNLMNVAQWPQLRWLGLSRTAVQGDLRDIQPGHDFLALQLTGLNHTMYGANEIDRVSHAPAVMRVRHYLIRQSTTQDIPLFPFMVRLSEHSLDYHERVEQRLYTSERDPPFQIETVQCASRRGWRWSNYLGGCCAVHWLDPEPTNNDDDDDALYQQELAQLQEESQHSIFLDLLEPPTPQEYQQLCRRL